MTEDKAEDPFKALRKMFKRPAAKKAETEKEKGTPE